MRHTTIGRTRSVRWRRWGAGLVAGLATLAAGCVKAEPEAVSTAQPSLSAQAGSFGAAMADPAPISRRAFSKGMHAGDLEPQTAARRAVFALADLAAPPKPLDRRLLHYTGSLDLQVTAPTDALAKAAALATTSGGYVERAHESTLVLRVPVARFHEVFDALQALGTVLRKSLTVEDISDVYRATDLRLATLRATRDRLQALLAHAKDEKDRVTILAQLEEVIESIDELETALATLSTLGALSRITLEVKAPAPVHEDPVELDLAALRWIHVLSATRYEVADRGERLELAVPEGFVALGSHGLFRVEAADRTTLWASRRTNEPRGDAAFWVEAIERRLAPGFSRVEPSRAGGFTILELVERGDDPYRYWVAVRVHDGDLDLAEAYFPSAQEYRRHGDAVRAVLAGEVSR